MTTSPINPGAVEEAVGALGIQGWTGDLRPVAARAPVTSSLITSIGSFAVPPAVLSSPYGSARLGERPPGSAFPRARS